MNNYSPKPLLKDKTVLIKSADIYPKKRPRIAAE